MKKVISLILSVLMLTAMLSGCGSQPEQITEKETTQVSMIQHAPDAEIHYTLDGSVPTIDSPKYEIPFSINRSQIVSAIAYRDGKPVGEVRTKRW